MTAEAAGIILSGYLLTKMRGKVVFAASSLIAGLTGLFMVLLTGVDIGSFFMIFVLTAKLGVSSGFNVIYIFHPKMFPTLFSMTSESSSSVSLPVMPGICSM